MAAATNQPLRPPSIITQIKKVYSSHPFSYCFK
jgi:hypothetical protein